MAKQPPDSPARDKTRDAEMQLLAHNLRAHVERLAGEIGERHVWRPRALHAAADYIRDEWRQQGYRVNVQRYDAFGVQSENLEVERTGSVRAQEIIVIGAHYDTVRGSPGADDNASGVAGLLELSRALAAVDPERTVRLVAFVNEEAPFFQSDAMGSSEYARAARRRGDDIRLMISLEMLGAYSDAPASQRYPPIIGWFYPERGNFIGFVSNFASHRALRRTVQAFRNASPFPSEALATFESVPGVGWSDHRSFWRAGYPALMVTDTAFYRYAWYHTAEDTPEKLDYARMAQVVQGLAGATVELARTETPL